MSAELEAAETRAVEARRVADAFTEQVRRRRRRWESCCAAVDTSAAELERAWTDYQHAIAQFRAASQTARSAESIWGNVLTKGHQNV